jgi:DNA-directed RNA polymerase
LELSFETDDNGFRTLVNVPSLGGIDLGDSKAVAEELTPTPTPEEIEERAAEEKKKRLDAKAKAKNAHAEGLQPKDIEERTAKAPKKPKKAKPSLPTALIGKTLWVKADKPWQCLVTAIRGDRAQVKVATGHAGAGNTKMVDLTDLTEDQPQKKPQNA